MASCNYISKHQLQGFNRYKYSCIENGIFSVYLFQPWWNTAVKIVPLWVAPNVLTLSGFLLHVTIVLLFAYYDYDYSTTSNDWGMRKEPIPSWVWLYAAVAHFTAHTLDGIDGKQARRTKSSTPVGELFDHGLDSMVCWFIPLCVYSVVGRGQEWGSDMMDGYWAASAILAGFFLMHWEKYITGTMYIPWSYDVGEIVC
jgi:ethanolaminephosphotransferase